jgi:hypothetical protein
VNRLLEHGSLAAVVRSPRLDVTCPHVEVTDVVAYVSLLAVPAKGNQ